MSLFAESEQWLSDKFPGSNLIDGYYFLKVVSPVVARLNPGKLQILIDELTSGRAWIIVVGADPRPFTHPKAWEYTTTYYNPDWNISEWMDMWLVEVHGDSLNLDGLSNVLEDPTLVAIFIPDRELVLHADLLSLHATDPLAIEVLKTNLPDCFEV